MNGLTNRLSDQSKDTVVRAIKGLYDANSVSIVNVVLRDCLLGACVKATQVMTTLIPTYAAVIAGLHFSVGVEMGGFVVETLTTNLMTALGVTTSTSTSTSSALGGEAGNNGSSPAHAHSLITSKLPHNNLLLLLHLYNVKMVHHQLIVDIMRRLVEPQVAESAREDVGEEVSEEVREEVRLELFGLIIEHSGLQLRHDDPDSLRDVMTTAQRMSIDPNSSSIAASNPTGTSNEATSVIPIASTRLSVSFIS